MPREGMALADRIVGRFKQAGATNFEVFVKNPDVKSAFAEALDDARHEHGHGQYTGTIAEKHGYEIRRRDPMTREEANRFIQQDEEKNDKHGPAFAISVTESVPTKEKKVTVKVPARDQYAASEEADKVLREKFAEPNMAIHVVVTGKTLVKEGKLPEMSIEKGGEEGFYVKGPGTSGKTFASRMEAITGFKTFVLLNKPQQGAIFKILKFKTTDQFTIGDTTKSLHMWEVEATLKFEKSTGKVLGWIFYGYASS